MFTLRFVDEYGDVWYLNDEFAEDSPRRAKWFPTMRQLYEYLADTEFGARFPSEDRCTLMIVSPEFYCALMGKREA